MDTDDIQPLTVTVEQAAKLLGIGRSTAYELVHTGDIPSLRLGRRLVVPIAAFHDFIGSPRLRSSTEFTGAHSAWPSDGRNASLPDCRNANS
jgi:excisionase family DNA binding protein